MALSFGPLFSSSLSLFPLIWSLLLPILVGCTVTPSNNPADLSWTDHLRFHLHLHLADEAFNTTLAPLTETLLGLSNDQLSVFNITGNLVEVGASNALSLGNSDIAFISCDNSAYTGLLDASETVSNVINAPQRPLAIVLYSIADNFCDFTSNAGSFPFYSVFTILSQDSARAIKSHFRSGHSSSIIEIMSYITSAPPPTSSDVGQHDSRGSPNTGSAMIILYSITGVITVLFLGIIVAGAIRAHRHPERYGPRRTPGRPRQSRAKGIARAMVDAIPIVKFGDANDVTQETIKGDVELAVEADERSSNLSRDSEAGSSSGEDEVKRIKAAAHDKCTNTDHGVCTAPDSPEAANLVCPICTDDFIKGEDIRVLPCNHSFHPECIDPWLMNVSGTCPLCRIDLNPEQAEGGEGEGNGTEAPQDGRREVAADTQGNRHHRGLTTYLHDTLNVRRMRDASVEERLAALRRVREANRNGAETEGEEGHRRRIRLAARLRERFRVRTRPHEGQRD